MTVRKFLLMIFVLTPLAAIQTLMGGMLISVFFSGDGFDFTSFIGPLILSVVIIIATNLAIFKLRYKDLEDHVLLFVIDIPFAVLRLPLILISDILAIISFFNDNLEVDPCEEPDISSDGFFGFLFIHFLMCKAPSDYRWAVREAHKADGEASDDPREYKWQAFRWHLKLWFVTLFHSIIIWGGLIYCYYQFEWYRYIGIIGSIIFFILIPVLYILISWKAIEMRHIHSEDEYYDNTTTTTTYYHYDEDNDTVFEGASYTVGPRWRSIISLQGILFLVTGLLWIVPQTIALLISLFTPPGAVILSCRHQDIDYDDLSLGNKILHVLFGFIIDN